MGPKFGNDGSDVPVVTQLLLLKIEQQREGNDSDGNGLLYSLILLLVNDGFRALLERNGRGLLGVMCHAKSGDDRATSSGKIKALYASVGDDPFEILHCGMKAVSKALGTFWTLDKKRLPESVEEFGWCMWNAFYSKVEPEGVLHGVETLQRARLPPRNVILDNEWQTVNPAPPSPPSWPSGSSRLSVIA